MKVPFRLLDVFAETPFSGNQLCVVPDVPEGLGADTMLTLAREIGFSETTFVTAVRDDGYDVRIFTPDAELPFAGHPTIGTAFVMVAEERVAPRSCRRRPPATYRSRSISRTDARRCTSCRRRSASRSTIAPRSRPPRASRLPT